MSKYEKGTKNYHRRISSRKEVRKNKGTKHLKELKSITIEFCLSSQREAFSPLMFDVLKEKGLNEYFTKCSQHGNIIQLYASKGYLGNDYKDIAVKMTENIGKYQFYEAMCPPEDVIYGYIKMYTRKGKRHIYIWVGFDEAPRVYNLLSGEGDYIGIQEEE